MAYDKPLPKITPLTRPFWDAARAHRLVVQTCRDCGDAHFPASPVCPACLSDAQEWKDTAGTGTLESWVAFHRAYWDGFRDSLPYDVCLVRLTEGPLLVSNLIGETGRAKLGAPVHVVFDSVTDTITLPKFTLA